MTITKLDLFFFGDDFHSLCRLKAEGKRVLEHLDRANKNANPELSRLALKLATRAGKTTVMAMLIAGQTVNAVPPDGTGQGRAPGTRFVWNI
jgi:hypothetical protein